MGQQHGDGDEDAPGGVTDTGAGDKLTRGMSEAGKHPTAADEHGTGKGAR
jgi:hypothetical protein